MLNLEQALILRAFRRGLNFQSGVVPSTDAGDNMARTVHVGISLVLLLGVFACAATSPTPPPAFGDIERASLGTVGVASFAAAPNTSLPDPGFISGAAKGAGDWAAFFGSGNGGFASLGILFFPVAGLVGGIEAETIGLSGKDKRAIAAMLRSVLPETQNELRQHVRTHAAADAKEMWLDLGTVGPRGQQTTPGYGLPSGKNVTTMLEVGLSQVTVTVTSADDKDPYIDVRITACARLLRFSDRRVLWSNDQFVNNIGARRLSEFQANDAALLKSNVVYTLDFLARDIVFAVLPEGRPNGERGCE